MKVRLSWNVPFGRSMCENSGMPGTVAVQMQPTVDMSLRYEVAPSPTTRDEWNVEAINYEGDGEIYAATFSGPRAYERALEYAAWKNGSLAGNEAPAMALSAR